MTRAIALGAIALMLAATTMALVGPWPIAGVLAIASLAAMRRGRGAFALFAATTLAINVLVVALVQRAWTTDGLAGAARLAGAMGANLAILSWYGLAQLIEDLTLPPRPTALLSAILLAAEDVARDMARLRMATRLEGKTARPKESARLGGLLLVGAQMRATARRDALQVVGLSPPAWFVPFVAIAALCAAGRMAFLAIPNVALTYLVAFAGGILFGPWIAAGAALTGMALTDLILTGLYPAGFVNAPAMALVAFAGAALRRVDWSGVIGRILAGAIGCFAVLLFSIASDAATWAIAFPGHVELLVPLLLAGLVFNILPAVANGILFAWGLSPALAAFASWQERARAPGATRATAPAPGPGDPARSPGTEEAPGSQA